MSGSRLLTRSEAAARLGIKTATLAAWALLGRNSLPYVKIGRLVRYRLEDSDAFIEGQVRTHTDGTNRARPKAKPEEVSGAKPTRTKVNREGQVRTHTDGTNRARPKAKPEEVSGAKPTRTKVNRTMATAGS